MNRTMGNNRILFFVLTLYFVLTGSPSAHAASFNFTDDYISFPGYPQNTGWGRVDEYGDPKIDSMTVTLDNTNKFLQSVVLNIKPTTGLKNQGDVVIRWDSLIINTSYVDLAKATDKNSWDQSWDYFVHSGGTNTDRGNASFISGDVQRTNGLYEILPTFDSTKDYTTVHSNGRNNHPDGIDKDLLGTTRIADITGVFSSQSLGNNSYGYKITYDFTALSLHGIAIDNGFTIAYTPWCANDVFLASALAPVPEPTAMLLFGTGLACLAGLGRRHRMTN